MSLPKPAKLVEAGRDDVTLLLQRGGRSTLQRTPTARLARLRSASTIARPTAGAARAQALIEAELGLRKRKYSTDLSLDSLLSLEGKAWGSRASSARRNQAAYLSSPPSAFVRPPADRPGP